MVCYLRLFQEMDEDYRHAVRKAILDYVLIDEVEQERLGMPVPKKVSVYRGHSGAPLTFQ